MIELTLPHCAQEHLNLLTLGCGIARYIFFYADWVQKCHWQMGNVDFIEKPSTAGAEVGKGRLLYAQLALGSFMRGI
jgi:hypothetical protein